MDARESLVFGGSWEWGPAHRAVLSGAGVCAQWGDSAGCEPTGHCRVKKRLARDKKQAR